MTTSAVLSRAQRAVPGPGVGLAATSGFSWLGPASSVADSSPGRRASAAGRQVSDQDQQRQHVGHGVEQVVAPPMPRSAAPARRTGAAEQHAAPRSARVASARRSPAPRRSGPGRWRCPRSSCRGRTATARRRPARRWRRRRGGGHADARPPNSPAPARAASLESPAMRTTRPRPRPAKPQCRRGQPGRPGTARSPPAPSCTCGAITPQAQRDRRDLRRLRLDQRLAGRRPGRCPAASARCRWRRR